MTQLKVALELEPCVHWQTGNVVKRAVQSLGWTLQFSAVQWSAVQGTHRKKCGTHTFFVSLVLRSGNTHIKTVLSPVLVRPSCVTLALSSLDSETAWT